MKNITTTLGQRVTPVLWPLRNQSELLTWRSGDVAKWWVNNVWNHMLQLNLNLRLIVSRPNQIKSIWSNLFVCPSVYLSIYPSIHPSIRPSVHPSIHPSIRLSVYLSICPTESYGLFSMHNDPWHLPFLFHSSKFYKSRACSDVPLNFPKLPQTSMEPEVPKVFLPHATGAYRFSTDFSSSKNLELTHMGSRIWGPVVDPSQPPLHDPTRIFVIFVPATGSSGNDTTIIRQSSW